MGERGARAKTRANHKLLECLWILLNRQKCPTRWIDQKFNFKSHKINLQFLKSESKVDTKSYLFIINSRSNHSKSHRKEITVDDGDMFTTKEIFLPQLWALDGVTVTTGRITPQRTSCGEPPLDLWLGDLHVIYLGLSIWPDVEDDAFISQVVVLPENTNENSLI